MHLRPLENAEPRFPRASRAVFLAVAVWLAVLLAATALGASDLCAFHRATGHPCAGCGSTRALLALAGGEPLTALRSNPLFTIALALTLVWLVLRSGFRRRVVLGLSQRGMTLLGLGLAAAIAANWIYLLATLPAPPGSRHVEPEGKTPAEAPR